MGRKKQRESTPPLREQAEAHIFEVVREFEEITGFRVDRIDVRHIRPAGYGAKDMIEVNIIIQQ